MDSHQNAIYVGMELLNLENNVRLAHLPYKDVLVLALLFHHGLVLPMLKINQYATTAAMELFNLENNVKLAHIPYKDVLTPVSSIIHGPAPQMHKINQYATTAGMELFNPDNFVTFHYIIMVAALPLVLLIKVTTVIFCLQISHIAENVVTSL